jgi:hypothetical protein
MDPLQNSLTLSYKQSCDKSSLPAEPRTETRVRITDFLPLSLPSFFDAKADAADADMTKMIGKQWTDVTTEGNGAYFSWNQSAGGIRRPGTGGFTSVTKMRSALLYMTKLDRYLKLSVPSGGRTFDRGNMPKTT